MTEECIFQEILYELSCVYPSLIISEGVGKTPYYKMHEVLYDPNGKVPSVQKYTQKPITDLQETVAEEIRYLKEGFANNKVYYTYDDSGNVISLTTAKISQLKYFVKRLNVFEINTHIEQYNTSIYRTHYFYFKIRDEFNNVLKKEDTLFSNMGVHITYGGITLDAEYCNNGVWRSNQLSTSQNIVVSFDGIPASGDSKLSYKSCSETISITVNGDKQAVFGKPQIAENNDCPVSATCKGWSVLTGDEFTCGTVDSGITHGTASTNYATPKQLKLTKFTKIPNQVTENELPSNATVTKLSITFIDMLYHINSTSSSKSTTFSSQTNVVKFVNCLKNGGDSDWCKDTLNNGVPKWETSTPHSCSYEPSNFYNFSTANILSDNFGVIIKYGYNKGSYNCMLKFYPGTFTYDGLVGSYYMININYIPYQIPMQ